MLTSAYNVYSSVSASCAQGIRVRHLHTLWVYEPCSAQTSCLSLGPASVVSVQCNTNARFLPQAPRCARCIYATRTTARCCTGFQGLWRLSMYARECRIFTSYQQYIYILSCLMQCFSTSTLEWVWVCSESWPRTRLPALTVERTTHSNPRGYGFYALTQTHPLPPWH